MKILVATDFSEPACHATDLAGALARRLGDRLVMAYAVEPTLVSSPDFMVDVESVEKAIEDKARARLAEEQARVRATGVEVDIRIERGQVAEVVARLGQELDPRLVVMGTHGRGAVSRFFLGSAAERAVLESERPVLVVRSKGDEHLQQWAENKRPLRVVVGVELSAASRHAVNWVRELRKSVPVDVTFLHFYWPPEQFSRLGLLGPRDMLDPDPATVRVLERDLRQLVGDLPGEGKIEFRIEPNWGEMGSHLALVAADLGADLLVMGTHQRRGLKRMWLGATMQPTLHASSVPVLCVPERDPHTAPKTDIPRFREVLVATDFSPLGNNAVPYAFGLVENGGRVHLVYVHERHLPNPLYAYEDTRGSIKGTAIEQQLRERLQGLIPPAAARREITTEVTIIDGGYPPNAILQAANRLGADAIVLSSHGRTGLGRAIMGSVTTAILEGADRPVFVVRGQGT